jgi:hypothetical protein
MCKCEQRRLAVLISAGDDLVAAIEKANWGTISHPTLHMEGAMETWKEAVCHLRPRKAE